MSLTLGADEVDHLAVVLEHVHLLDRRDVGDTNPLQGRCQLLVICNRATENRATGIDGSIPSAIAIKVRRHTFSSSNVLCCTINLHKLTIAATSHIAMGTT